MRLVDIIAKGKPGLYIITEPACDPKHPEYNNWKGLIIKKLDYTPAIVVYSSGNLHGRFENDDLLPLSGMAVKSEYKYLGSAEGSVYV